MHRVISKNFPKNLLWILIVVAIGCSSQLTNPTKKSGDEGNAPTENTINKSQGVGSAKIATMNMRWLNDQLNTGTVHRAAADYAAVSQVLDSSGAAMIAIQEIENESAVQELVINQHLPGKSYNVMTTGETSQEPGIFWNSNLATVSRLSIPVSISGFTRTPFFASFQIGNFDGTIVVVHLKAGSDTASKSKRALEMNSLLTWATNYLAEPANDPDLIIVGDFNFNPSDGEIVIPSPFNVLKSSSPTLVSGNDTVDFFITSSDTSEIVSTTPEVLNTGLFLSLYSSNVISDHWVVRIEIDGSKGRLDRSSTHLKVVSKPHF